MWCNRHGIFNKAHDNHSLFIYNILNHFSPDIKSKNKNCQLFNQNL